MANAPLKKCAEPSCRTLVRGQSRCEKHAKVKWTRSKASASYQWMYQTPQWKARAAQHKKENPLCAECERNGRTTAVYCTDHIVPHRGDERLFFDEDNWQSLCRDCHQTKTMRGE